MHVEIIVHELGLQETKFSSIPPAKIDVDSDEQSLDDTQATKYKSVMVRTDHTVVNRSYIYNLHTEVSARQCHGRHKKVGGINE